MYRKKEGDGAPVPYDTVSYTYDSWGNILSATGTLAQTNPFRYRGYYYDTETQFYYLRSRYYNPQIGRFLNADGLYSTGQGVLGYNMFSYCLNNPVMYSDYCGACSREEIIESIKEILRKIVNIAEVIILKTFPRTLKHDGSNTSTYAGESDMSVIARMIFGEDGESAEAHIWLLQNRLTAGNYGGNDFRSLTLASNQFYAMDENRALDPASHFNKLGEKERWDHCVDVAYAYITGGITAVPKPSETFNYTWSHAYSDSIATQYPDGVHIGGTWFYNK